MAYIVLEGGSMTQDDAAARKAKAERLRKEIETLTESDDEAEDAGAPMEGHGEDGETTPKGAPAGESPRDFIQRRMRQLDEKTKDKHKRKKKGH
jgi:hypothetical protein